MGGNTNAVALMWDDADAGGPTGAGYVAFAGTGDATQRYDAWDYDTMNQFGWGPSGWPYGLAWRISSVSLFAPVTGATVVLLYSNGQRFPFSFPTRFDYFFLLLDNRSGNRWDVNLADHPLLDGKGVALANWNDAATSMIVVHTAQAPEIRLPAAATLRQRWNTIIDAQLATTAGGVARVRRAANPRFEWCPFPKLEHLNPNRNYLRVHQELDVTLDDPLPDYEAYFRYYLSLVPSNGGVTGRVARWEYWVEGGLLTEFVEAVLRPNVILGADSMNDFLRAGVPLPPGMNVTRLYYLPGVQTDASQPGERQVFRGSAGDDATIVLETG